MTFYSYKQLFNSVQQKDIPIDISLAIKNDPANLSYKKLNYTITSDELPKIFNPLNHIQFPADVFNYWFYTDKNGKITSIITDPLDQAGCGSCWSFAAASMFTDRIRIALLKRYGQDAVVKSTFFQEVETYTGDIGFEEITKTINSDKVNLKKVKTRDRISAYSTAIFSPKLNLNVCDPNNIKTCIDATCGQEAVKIWRDSVMKGMSWGDIKKDLGDKEAALCVGCQGNLLVCPHILYTGNSKLVLPFSGTTTISQFPIQFAACIYGLTDYCPKGQLPESFKYKADYYVYDENIPEYIPDQNIISYEDLHKKGIYTHGPVTVCYGVYKSFMDFFYDKNNKKSIYALENFTDQDSESLGGHSIVVIGWGEELLYGRNVRYWICRNSWGTDWADEGYFRIEINLPKIGFENGIATILFADKNEKMFDGKHNDMMEFMQIRPQIYDYATYMSMITPPKKSNTILIIVIILIVITISIILVVYFSRRSNKSING